MPSSNAKTSAGEAGETKEFERLPKHVAIIMDGNGRWAKSRSLIRSKGHDQGANVVRDITTECARLNIEQLTLYAFSTENWKRPKAEVAFLMKLLEKFLIKERPTMMQNNIKFTPIGLWQEFPTKTRNQVQQTIDETAGNTGTQLSLALNYSGRSEMTRAVQNLAAQAKAGELDPASITEDTLADSLYTAGMPEVDLLIRTAGEMRVSNFLLWQISYAEFWVTDVLWPDFTLDTFHEALGAYNKRERRFGGLQAC